MDGIPFGGLLVSLISWKIDKERFIFFFYSGLIFVFIGIVKLAFNLAKSKAVKKDVPEVHRAHKYCQRCGSAVSLHARFCPRCGASLAKTI